MKIAEFTFLNDRNTQPKIHLDVELFYLMAGSGELTIEEKKYRLEKEDFIVINSGLRHSFHSSDPDYLGVSILFSLTGIKEASGRDMIYFLCSSMNGRDDRIDSIRELIGKLAREQYYNRNRNEMRSRSLYYEILDILTNYYLVGAKNRKSFPGEEDPDERKLKITEYVNQNFDRDISLKELSDQLYLSNAYLSKYIKRQFGMTFIDYVNSVRVNHAVNQLLYSGKQLSRIAADAGFSGTTAMNKAFRDRYNMTAVEYRNLNRISGKEQKSSGDNGNELRKMVGAYFDSHSGTDASGAENRTERVVIDTVRREPFEKPWTRMINVGTLTDLLHSDMQKQILCLKDRLNFRYVRFWGLHSPETYLCDEQGSEFNFDKLDRVLDFLTKNDLIPYIELRRKTKILIQNGSVRIGAGNFLEYDEDLEVISNFTRKMIIHLINRYSALEVEKWYFEVWKHEIEQCEDGEVIGDRIEDSRAYLDVFDCISKTLRKYLPNVQVGGGGLALRFGEDRFREQLLAWKKRKNLPDFLSVYCYPYGVDAIAYGKTQSLDEDFIPKTIRRIRELMAETEFPVDRLHVTEWNFSVSARNVLNDHCMKAAYLTNCMIGTVGQTEIMGYWIASDLFSDYYDSGRILNGAPGLVSKYGIPKPAFYAFDFMNRLGRNLIATGEHYIITDNGSGNYRIVCHNLKYLSYHYGMLTEDEHIIETVDGLMTNQKTLKLRFELPASPGGTYSLRTYLINRRYGSLLDSWNELSGEADLSLSDIEYLDRVTTPRLLRSVAKEQNGKVIFDSVLEPNEIRFLYLSLNYE